MPRIVAPIGLQLSPSASPSAAKDASAEKVMLQANFVIQAYAVKTSLSGNGANSSPPKPAKKD